ncbi:MAG TPA: acyltransferase [Acidobacteriaceae bacterium]|nr:acyltransferase [Acidobacteriaceae bacterium]
MTEVERVEAQPPAARFESVDLLRGLSILAVVLLHSWLRFFLNDVHVGTRLPRWLAQLLLRNGGNGVTIFFAISGFLITLTSLRRFGSLSRMQLGRFYRIRFARIAPLLLLLLTVLCLLHWAALYSHAFAPWHVKKNIGLPRALFSALTFHLNWLEAKAGYLPANWDVLWSLSVEEMFYLFFPLACVAFVGRRSPLRKVGWPLLFLLAGVLLVLGPWARSVWITTDIGREKSYLGGMNAIAMGCLAALLCDRLAHTRQLARRWTFVAEAAGWVLIAWMATWPRWAWLHGASQFLGRTDLDDTLLPLAVCLVMVATVLRGSSGGGWLTAPLRWFGRHSYEVYLTHEFLVLLGVIAFLRWHGTHPAFWVAGITLSTAPLGWAVAHYFSEPMNRRLRGPSPTKPRS